MSFRIEDILGNKPSSLPDNEVNEEIACSGSEHEKDVLSPSYDEDNHGSTYFGYWNHSYRLALAAAATSMDGTRNDPLTRNHSSSCCANSIYLQNNIDCYSPTIIYPEKLYNQTTYSHMLPFSLAMCSHVSKRRNQVRFSPSQTKALESKFSWQKYLSPEDRKVLAHSLKLSDRQVKTWFQNRRAKWRRNASCSSPNSEMKSPLSNSAA
ncbi:hypothetical protein GWI33_004981 [Rhynchophorus ferrugineus]|uniref:Homeobox domain-containing protein n=1 Tax=Rhynchophorus ferrugineus TaxID=354439 RepID=A0A834IWM2_RHYFE|nr:hypothetical protein GWI33_004981 [Rhynchophorus ferrugineus]